jgi:hypothetical protein
MRQIPWCDLDASNQYDLRWDAIPEDDEGHLIASDRERQVPRLFGEGEVSAAAVLRPAEENHSPGTLHLLNP